MRRSFLLSTVLATALLSGVTLQASAQQAPETIQHAMVQHVRADDADVSFFVIGTTSIGDVKEGPAPYLSKIEHYRAFFTDAGWKEYMAAVEQAKLSSTVDGHHLAIITEQAGDAVIDQRQTDPQGRPTWTVHVPIKRSFFSDPNTTFAVQNGRLDLNLVQTTLNGHIQPGLKVNQLIFVPTN